MTPHYQAIQNDLNDVVAGRRPWPHALQRVSDLFLARGSVLLSTEKPSLVISSPSLEETTRRYQSERWYTRDIRFRGLPKIRQTGVAVDLDFADENDFQKSDYYNDFLGRHSLRWSACIGVPTAEDYLAVSFQRTPQQGPFTQREQKYLLSIRSLFSSAFETARLIESAQAQGAIGSLEQIGVPALAVDHNHRVTQINALGELLMPRLFIIASGRMHVGDRRLARQINVRISSILNSPIEGVGPPIIFRPSPNSNDGALFCYVLPMPEPRIKYPLSSSRVLILFLEHSNTRLPPANHLKVLFDLTPAQAGIALLLLNGHSLEHAADLSSISKETARNHLKLAFAKTGTTRQSELVSLLSRLLPAPPKAVP